jgi:hypothetical protein
MRPLPLLFLALASLTACTGGEDVIDRLRSCELLTEGFLQDLPVYAPTECYRQCLGEGSCEELEAALCRSDVELLVACDRRCAFTCASGAIVAVDAVCNGFEDCAEGEDEVDCPVHVCDDGTEVMGANVLCDGRQQCPDRSDEEGCPIDCDRRFHEDCPPFVCDDGQEVQSTARCNGWPQCMDESDEEGCAELQIMCEAS